MKTVIVTGASGNMGRAIVKKFLAQGHRVIGTVVPDSNSPVDIDDPNFETAGADLANEKAAQQVVASLIEKYQSIDILVSTVGGYAAGKIADTKASDITKQISLNFETAYNISRPVFAQMMKQQSGRIFLVGSKPGLSAASSKGMVAYGLAKSLIFRLAELMNDEAKGLNIVTSVIVPGTIDTPPNRSAMPNADFESWVTPESIADVVYFYSTAEADILREPVIKVYNNA